MRARFLLQTLSACALFCAATYGAAAQESPGLGAPASAKVEAYVTAGVTRDTAVRGQVVAQALYVKLKKGAVSGTPWGTAAQLASRAGLSVASASPRPFSTMTVDKDLASRLASLPAEKRARIAAAQDEIDRIVELHFTDDIAPSEAARRLKKMPGIEYAEPIPVVFPLGPVVPNDPRISEQTHLTQIRAFDAWGLWQGDTNMVIGVVDAGIDMYHEDLAPNIKENLGEYGLDGKGQPKQSNGIDDDKDGVIDDWRGANLTAKQDSSPYGDTRGINHGTVVSGLAAAATNNGIGVAGTGNRCKFFPVKTAVKQGGNLIFAYDGIEYCAKRGMKVINCSFGSDGYSHALEDLINSWVEIYDVAICAGAGNTPDYLPFYPAGYRHVLGVGAIDNSNVLGTTWGEQVGINAPSNLSTNDNNQYTQAGVYTSFATPVVSGVMALVRSRYPDLTADQAIAHVRLTADNVDDANAGKEKMVGYGRVNAFRAVGIDPFAHPAISVDSIWLTDTQGRPRDNFDIGEEGKLHVRLKNILGKATNVKVTAAVYGPDTAMVSFAGTPVTLAAIDSNGVGTPDDGIPFHVKAADYDRVKLRFDFTADNSYTDYEYEKQLIYKPFIDDSTSLISVSLTSRGHIGFEDYSENRVGNGLRYDGSSMLFEGGFVIASSADHVVGNVRDVNPDKEQQDFATVEAASAANDYTLTLNDSKASADRRIGLEMRVKVVTQPTSDNAFGILLRTRNVSGAVIDSLRIGMFNDWDIDSTPYGQRILYAEAPNTGIPFYGTITSNSGYAVASGVAYPAPLPVFYAIQNDRAPLDIFNGFSAAKKWLALSNGVGSTSAGSANEDDSLDISLLTGKRIANFASNAEDTTLFVIGFGFDTQDAANAMKAFGPHPTSSVEEPATSAAAARMLGPARPNPFTGQTTIQVRGGSPGATLRIFDALGREVTDLTGRIPSGHRSAEITFDASGLANGTYYIRFSSADRTESETLLLAR